MLAQKEHAQKIDTKQFLQRKQKDRRADIRTHIPYIYDPFVMIKFYDHTYMNKIIRNEIELIFTIFLKIYNGSKRVKSSTIHIGKEQHDAT